MNEYRLTEEEYRRILALKRDLHMYPETAGKEIRTTEKIREMLLEIPGVELLPFENPLGTGLVARIRGSEEGPETALRADIDALPQNEEYESEWKSRVPGVMHACGHDFHTASLVGAAMILSRAAADGALRGTADLIFQPAEEGTRGAAALIDGGLFDVIRPDRIFGIHNWPSVRSGDVVIHEGPLMAGKRNFTITVFGQGGHGSMPHLNIDPIVCAAAVIQSLQTVISRNMNPMDAVLLSVNRIEGGRKANVVAGQVEMSGTVRSLSDRALDRAIERIEAIVKGTAEAYECRHRIDWERRIPAVSNRAEMCVCAGKAAAAAAGAECVTDAEPSLASEDFALYGAAGIPSFFYWVGSTPPGEKAEHLHRPCFHTDDSAMKTAAALYAASVLQIS
ncbi:MAG: amidohydrolase [Lachnospiraceae bacterium]|nr:amidohydrolase [Lachnospiraceae bacterium]